MARARPTAKLLAVFLGALLVRGPAVAAVPLPQVAEAAAAQGPTVGVAVFCLDKKVRAEAGLWEHALEDALKKGERFEVVSTVDLYDSQGAKSRASKRADAAQRIKEGAKALDDLDNQKATEAFTQAVAGLRETDLSQSWPEFLDALRFKAASHAMGGENGPARQELERLLSLDPAITLSSTFFSPDLLKFAEAQRRGIQNAKGELTLKTWPDGAPVWVDGKFRGLAPVTVKGLAAGKHFVTVKLGGFALSQSELGLGTQNVELKPAEDSGAFLAAEKRVSKDPLGAERDAAVRALMKRAGVEQLVAVVLKKSLAGEKVEATALRLEGRDGHNWAYAQATVGMGDQDAVVALAEKLVSKDESRKAGPVTHYIGGGATGTQKVGFALLGVGAVATGLGIVLGVNAQNKATEFRGTPQVQTLKSAGLVADGRAFALGADISYVIGGASLITGAILALVGGSGGGAEPEPAPKKKSDESKSLKKTEPEKKASSFGSSSGSDFGKKSREDDKRRREEEERRKKEDEERAQRDAADRKRDDDARAEEVKKKDDEERDAKKDTKKKTRREREEEERERKRKEDEARADDQKKRDEERKRKEDEARAEEQKKRDDERDQKRREDEARAEEQRKKADEERAAKKDNKKKTRHERDEEERRKREEAADQKKKDEERKRADEEARKREDEARKKADEDKKKKTEDHDDLRNF